MPDTRIVEAVDDQDLPSLKLLVEEDGADLDAFDGLVRFLTAPLRPPLSRRRVNAGTYRAPECGSSGACPLRRGPG